MDKDKKSKKTDSSDRESSESCCYIVDPYCCELVDSCGYYIDPCCCYTDPRCR